MVYGIKQYWDATGDDAFMRDFGAEIVLSAGQFFASRLEWEERDSAYHIKDVIGPDEYHEHVDDNAMTNLMGRWVLRYAAEIAGLFMAQWKEKCDSLLETLGLSFENVNDWVEMANQITVHQREDGVIEQFDGYFDLSRLDQAELEPRHQSLQSLFGIEGVQKYQFIKQPDAVMALHLLEDDFTEEVIRANMTYYTPRTDFTYGSSLGPSIQALMLAKLGEVEAAKDLFIKTLLTDLEDNRGNSADGIHAASAGAVWQVLVKGFGGMEVGDGAPDFSLRLPNDWQKVRFVVLWQNQRLGFDNF